jgi:hypothetical protein
MARSHIPQTYQHFSSLELANFRGFGRRQVVPLRPLTFIVGPNSSGKTSLTHAILLMAQSGIGSEVHARPTWSGALADLGSFRDNVFNNDQTKVIRLGVILSGINTTPWLKRKTRRQVKLGCDIHRAEDDKTGYISHLSYLIDEIDIPLEVKRRRGRYPSYTISLGSRKRTWKPRDIRRPWLDDSLAESIAEFVYDNRKRPEMLSLLQMIEYLRFGPSLMKIRRVSSARSAPQRWYSNQSALSSESSPVLIDGFHPHMLDASRRAPSDLHSMLEKYLKESLERLDIADDISVKELSQYHNAIVVRDNRTKVKSNLIDVGYGTSQVLPVLWALGSPGNATVVLEQPEVHLHPRAQGIMGDEIVHAATHRQIIVETHSEHLINRARLWVARGDYSPDDVVIVYVDRDRLGSKTTAIEIDRNGDFSRQWPSGFFDERYADTMELARISSERRNGRRS